MVCDVIERRTLENLIRVNSTPPRSAPIGETPIGKGRAQEQRKLPQLWEIIEFLWQDEPRGHINIHHPASPFFGSSGRY